MQPPDCSVSVKWTLLHFQRQLGLSFFFKKKNRQEINWTASFFPPALLLGAPNCKRSTNKQVPDLKTTRSVCIKWLTSHRRTVQSRSLLQSHTAQLIHHQHCQSSRRMLGWGGGSTYGWKQLLLTGQDTHMPTPRPVSAHITDLRFFFLTKLHYACRSQPSKIVFLLSKNWVIRNPT